MGDFLEIRWHARAGQGAVTAAKTLVSAALSGGKYIQAFPEYGPEREGAPLRAFNRISDKPINLYAPVLNPDIVVIIDQTLITTGEVTSGIKENSFFIVNSHKSPAEIQKILKVNNKVFTVNASKISEECLGRVIPNTPMLGAILKATELFSLEILLKEVKKDFGKKFEEKVVNANLECINRAYQEVKST